ncbi:MULTISPECIES: FAD-dependent monooxygenase [unclassified Streptomyces]|uniref:aromatic-ring hydroxylase C-terminal domain-containing protein n=1 Tax=unclassified Streptomyces TaxID=2593676 RepID=UPI00380D0449
MNTGLQDAANLSWKLAMAVRGRTPEGLLVITPVTHEGSVVREERLTVKHWAGDRRTTVLVRPDGHVAWAAEDADVTEAEEAVARYLG